MSWIAPSLAYLVLLGGLGITTKYALRSLTWQELVVWSALAYVAIAAVLVTTGTPLRPHSGLNGGMAVVSALIAPVSLALLFLALRAGDASRVIPLTAAYPLVTVLLALLVLNEALSIATLVGATFVVVGAVLLTL
jgi:bacterial/archaeal transporter family protein